MSYQSFLIAPYTTGVDSATRPWLLPKDAFQSLVNGYIHHGITFKRNGIQLFGRLVAYQTSILLATAANPATFTVAAAAGLANGTEVQLNYITGGSFTTLNGFTYTITNLIGATFNLLDEDGNLVDTTGFGIFLGGTLSLFPGLPVMGLRTFVNGSNERLLLAMDTRRVNLFDPSINAFQPLDTSDVFSGGNSNFFWSATFGKTDAFPNPTIFFTNNVDNIRYYQSGTTTTAFVPDANPASPVLIQSCQFIFTLKQRLILLNTLENGIRYGQRMRWCRAGNPAASGDNWSQATPGNGGFVDAPTSENIISAKDLQDLIVVHFTNSVWLIRPTSDPALPFRWDRVNAFRASDTPYGAIGHDRYIISIGKRGIVACDGVEVKRIDDKVENFLENEVNTAFLSQVYSERNYAERRSWTLYPSAENEADTSDRALIRTEEEGAWSIYEVEIATNLDDLTDTTTTNMSCLGFGEVTQDYAFQDFDGRPGAPDNSWEDFAAETWSSYFIEADSEVFVGGDQIGRVHYLEKDGDDLGRPISFELISAGWNPFIDQGFSAQMGYIDFYLDADKNTEFTVEFFSNDIISPYASQTLNCLPPLGYIADIQNITQANPAVVTADSHGLETGDQVFIYGVKGMIQVSDGPFTVTVIDGNTFSLDGIDSSAYDAYISGGQVVEREFDNIRCWKRAYAGGKGYQHFIRITNSGIDDQLAIHAYRPWFRQAGSRTIG